MYKKIAFMLVVIIAPALTFAFEILPVTMIKGAYSKKPNKTLDEITIADDQSKAQCASSTGRFIFGGFQPLHEAITRSAYSEAGHPILKESWVSPRIAGVIWNDDPEYLSRKKYYGDGGEKALYYKKLMNEKSSVDPLSKTLTRRSHYKDLQFLHSMATTKDEKREETLRNIYLWLRTTYAIAQGKIAPEQDVSKTVLGTLFTGNPCKGKYSYAGSTCTVIELFDLSMFWRNEKQGDKEICNDYLLKDREAFSAKENALSCVVRSLALGAFLHTIQDGYSASHVVRDAFDKKKVLQFYSYPNEKHCESDMAVVSNKPNIDLAYNTSVLILKKFYKNTSWNELVPTIRDIYSMSEDEIMKFDLEYEKIDSELKPPTADVVSNQ